VPPNEKSLKNEPLSSNTMPDTPGSEQRLTPQQRGAMITNSGKSPIAGLPESERKQLISWVLGQSLQDRKLREIASDLGIAKTSLSQALLKYAEDDWKEVQVAKAWTQVEQAEDDLETAADMLAVQRARERLKSAQWQLERLHRRLFGQEAPNQLGQGTVQINIGINRNTPRVVDDAQVIDVQVEGSPPSAVSLTGKGDS
jgi:hypothetical protein